MFEDRKWNKSECISKNLGQNYNQQLAVIVSNSYKIKWMWSYLLKIFKISDEILTCSDICNMFFLVLYLYIYKIHLLVMKYWWVHFDVFFPGGTRNDHFSLWKFSYILNGFPMNSGEFSAEAVTFLSKSRKIIVLTMQPVKEYERTQGIKRGNIHRLLENNSSEAWICFTYTVQCNNNRIHFLVDFTTTAIWLNFVFVVMLMSKCNSYSTKR